MSLDLQLLELRRSLDVATTKIDGQLAILLQKSDYAEQRARESAERVAAELAARDAKMEHFETRLDNIDKEYNRRIDVRDKEHNALKAKVYFMSGIATAIGGAIGIISELLMHGH
jgi:hypothetical protein